MTSSDGDWSPLRSSTWTPLERAAAERLSRLCQPVANVPAEQVDLQDVEYMMPEEAARYRSDD